MPSNSDKAWRPAALMLMLPAASLGAQQEAARGAALDGGQLLQVMLALIAVLVIIVGLFALIRKLNMLPGASNGVIRVIGGLSLGTKERLVLIQVGEEQILVSASPGAINKVHKLEKPVDTAALGNPAARGRKGFSEVFRSVMEGRKP